MPDIGTIKEHLQRVQHGVGITPYLLHGGHREDEILMGLRSYQELTLDSACSPVKWDAMSKECLEEVTEMQCSAVC